MENENVTIHCIDGNQGEGSSSKMSLPLYT
jgi:hypothetical protein